ncbi:MAG: ATP-binding cassette domain-containing protein [Clostridiales bacterium]|nr:ATP-binding cassette domain-containing protein [Clostridiales bacterium]
MPEDIIRFEDFSFRYDALKEPTLKGIHLRIRAGEKVLILGASGSGKSTLLHCLNGLIPHTYPGEIRGELYIKGKPARDLSLFQRSLLIGTLLQDPDAQFVGLTVGEDMAFALENEALPQREMKERVEAMAQKLGLSPLLPRMPQTLSGGQKQKVAIGGVLISDVEILLFDEPLASLDPVSGKEMVALLDRLHRETGVTLIVVEHRLEEMLQAPLDRIVLLDQGRIALDGPPEEVLGSPLLAEAGIKRPLVKVLEEAAGCRPGEGPSLCQKKLWTFYRSLPPEPAAPKGKVLLSARDLRFGYEEGQEILKGVSLDIREGEAVALLGPNGAGKSTLARLLTGFLFPDEGKIFWEGREITREPLSQRAQKIGFVLQNPSQMISQARVEDEVALGLRRRHLPPADIREKVREALDLLNLSGYETWPVRALSRGEQKRLTLASMLVLEPRLLILDEPTAGFDAKNARQLQSYLRRLKERGHSLLLITHDMDLVLQLVERVWVLWDGRIHFDGEPSLLFRDRDLLARARLTVPPVLSCLEGLGLPAADLLRRFSAWEKEVKGREGADPAGLRGSALPLASAERAQ